MIIISQQTTKDYMKIKINKSKKNLWSGRFKENPSDSMIELNASIKFDKKLFEADIKASMHHAKMLANNNIITENEANKIKIGLSKVRSEIKISSLRPLDSNLFIWFLVQIRSICTSFLPPI